MERDDTCRLQQLLSSSEQNFTCASGILQLAKCLYVAAARGHLQCARLLLDAGAQPNIRGDTNGNTPLVCLTLSLLSSMCRPTVCKSLTVTLQSIAQLQDPTELSLGGMTVVVVMITACVHDV